MEILFPARLSLPPQHIFAGDGEFRDNRSEWLQPTQYWTIIYYAHANSVSINSRTFQVQPESIVIFPPGCRGTNAIIGDATYHMSMSFDLPAESGKRYAIPAYLPNAQSYRTSFNKSCFNVVSDLTFPKAFAWNFMLQISYDASRLRQNEPLYAAEDFILRHLSESLRVPQIAEAANTSPRQLLRMFREEHRLTIQEFIRAKRTQEACRLLSTTHRPIKVIAEQIGVPDLAQFNKLIRSQTGTSPRAFREIAVKKL
ncbi:hypothetical protein C0431_11460 [bacterium]|nr:hypothetical protein [bacterium]